MAWQAWPLYIPNYREERGVLPMCICGVVVLYANKIFNRHYAEQIKQLNRKDGFFKGWRNKLGHKKTIRIHYVFFCT